MSAAAVAALICVAVCSLSPTAAGGTASETTQVQHSAVLATLEWLGAWWVSPAQPLEVQPLLPESRPQQPWPYRSFNSAQHLSINLTETYALQATVVHAPLKGATACQAAASGH